MQLNGGGTSFPAQVLISSVTCDPMKKDGGKKGDGA